MRQFIMCSSSVPKKRKASRSELESSPVKPEKYVPPHKRQKSEKVCLQTTYIQVLNRVSEGNMDIMATQLVKAFQDHHSDMSDQVSNLMDYYVQEYLKRTQEVPLTFFACFAGLILKLTSDIGNLVAAVCVQKLTAEFLRILPDSQERDALRRVATTFCVLFEYQILPGDFILSLMGELLQASQFLEFRLELCQRFLTFSSRRLKLEFPGALSDFFEIARTAVGELPSSPRLDHFLDEITSLQKGHRQSSAVDRFAYVTSWVQRNTEEIEYLLLPANLTQVSQTHWFANLGLKLQKPVAETSDFLGIAKSLRMNTEKKLGLFVAIADAQSPADAIDRTTRLLVHKKDFSLLLSIVIEVALSEFPFNTFYVSVLQGLVKNFPKKMADLRRVLISFLQKMKMLDHSQVSNLTELVIHLVVNLKILQLGLVRFVQLEAEKPVAYLYRQLLVRLIDSNQDTDISVLARYPVIINLLHKIHLQEVPSVYGSKGLPEAYETLRQKLDTYAKAAQELSHTQE